MPGVNEKSQSVETGLQKQMSMSLNYSLNQDGVSGFITDQVRQVFITVNWAAICAGLCCFGIAGNSINIRVFTRHGFQETVNVTLFALAISDLGSLVSLLWMCICVNPLFQYADTSLLTVEIQNISGGWPHVIFVKITGWLTTFVTFERCLCVLVPLKVKAILTPTRVKGVIVCIYLFVIVSAMPSMATARLDWKFVPERNRTMFGMIVSDLSLKIDAVTFMIHGFASTFIMLVLTITFTLTLIISINIQSKWRQKTSANTDTGQQTVTRDQKLIKMLIVIATIFIACLMPFAAMSGAVVYNPDFNVLGRYMNLYLVASSFGLTLEAVNSSVNIIVYYKMNSKYRDTFRKIFRLDSKTEIL